LNKLQWRYNKENLENGIWGNNNSGMNWKGNFKQ
jgi:hypothetical protein